jgi:hypothetical protein
MQKERRKKLTDVVRLRQEENEGLSVCREFDNALAAA